MRRITIVCHKLKDSATKTTFYHSILYRNNTVIFPPDLMQQLLIQRFQVDHIVMGYRYPLFFHHLDGFDHLVSDRSDRKYGDIIPVTQLFPFSYRQYLHLVTPIFHLPLTSRVTDYERAIKSSIACIHQIP